MYCYLLIGLLFFFFFIHQGKFFENELSADNRLFMKIILLSLLLCLFCSWNVAAQGNDMSCYPEDTIAHQLSKKEFRRRQVAKRNIHYYILGGPSYTPDFGALIGGSALVTFRMNPSDTLQKRSVLPMAVAVMFEGGLNLMVKPQLFFKNDKFRIF